MRYALCTNCKIFLTLPISPSLFIVLSVIVLVLAIIGLIFGRKAKVLGIRDRKIALLLIPAAFVLFVVGGMLLPDTEKTQTATTNQEAQETVPPTPSADIEEPATSGSPSPSPKPSPTTSPKSTAKPTATPAISIAPEVDSYAAVIHFPADKYPGTAAHIQEAIDSGESTESIPAALLISNRQESMQSSLKVCYAIGKI